MEFCCRLKTIEEIKRFTKLASKCVGDITVSTGHYTVDGKSVLGMFSLDLTKPVTVNVSNVEDAHMVSQYYKVCDEK